MPTNGEKITTKFDLYDTVGYCLVKDTLNEVSYQTPFGWPYDFYTTTTKDEVKVRNKVYEEPEIEYTKVAEMLLQRYEDEKKGIKNNYLFHYVVVPENTMYTINLDTVLQYTYQETKWPVTTVDDTTFKRKLVYKIPISQWQNTYCDCSNYDRWIKEGKKKYGL